MGRFVWNKSCDGYDDEWVTGCFSGEKNWIIIALFCCFTLLYDLNFTMGTKSSISNWELKIFWNFYDENKF